MFPFGIATGGGGLSSSSSARSGDVGAVSFGGFGGLTLGDQGIDPRWLIGGAVVIALLAVILLTKKRR